MAADLIVIGAGPAGMMAASLAAENGATVTVLDDPAGPGGQIYRAVEQTGAGRDTILGEDFSVGRDITCRFRASGAQYRQCSTVWQVTDDREIAFSGSDGAHLIKADNIILATGAIERPFPVPGWTRPGVMTVGAAQTLLKASSLTAEGAVFAGTGPLVICRGAVCAGWRPHRGGARHDRRQATDPCLAASARRPSTGGSSAQGAAVDPGSCWQRYTGHQARHRYSD